MRHSGSRTTLLLLLLLTSFSVGQITPTPQTRTIGPDSDSEAQIPSWVGIQPPCTPANPDPGPAIPESPIPSDPGAGQTHPVALIEASEASTAGREVTVRPDLAQDRDLAYFYDSFEGKVRFTHRQGSLHARVLTLDFTGLYEFVDADHDGLLGSGDEIVAEMKIHPGLLHFARTWEGDCGLRLQWMYLLTVDQTTLDGVPSGQQAAYLEDKPRLVLRFTHLAQAQHSDGAYVVPERVKIDIGIEDYVPRGPNTMLAFQSTLVTDEALEARGDEVAALRGGDSVGYSWAKTAFVDGREEVVRAKVEDDRSNPAGDGVKIMFVYPQGASILHDPELGLLDWTRLAPALRALSSGHPLVIAVGASAGAVLLLVAGATRRRFV